MTNENKEEKKWTEIQGGTVHNFEEKTTVEGTLLDVQSGKFESNNYVLENEDKTTTVVFGTTVLQTKMASVKVGDQVRITRLEKVKSPSSGREYQDFKVEVQKADTPKTSTE